MQGDNTVSLGQTTTHGPEETDMNKPTIPAHLAVRQSGMSMDKRVLLGLLLSVICSGSSLAIGVGLGRGWDEAYPAFIGGAAYGLFPLGIIFILMVRKLKLYPAAAITFGVQFIAALCAALLIPGSAYTGITVFVLYAWGGSAVGAIGAMLWAPRVIVYRYATCPGCGYDLTLLAKCDVCPECGRDNRDLVEMFADLETQNKQA